jgi:Ca-activated chloride channel family protein
MSAKARSGWISLIMFLGFAASTGSGQETPATIRAEVALVNVIFSALDRNDQFVRGLKADDFLVLEDQQPQKIEYFSDLNEASEVPLTIALLIDTSGSVKNKLSFEVDTAAEFFTHVLREKKDVGLIVQFDSEVNLVQDFTDDCELLIRALHTLQPGTSTSMYDAVYAAVDEKLKYQGGRKVIVIITDGDDTSSKVDKDEAVAMAQRNDVLIYGIGIKGSLGANFGVLRAFAEQTGGTFFSPRVNAAEIRAAFRSIGQDLRGRYSLAYSSRNKTKDGHFRAIQIRAKPTGLRIRARKGYYAPMEGEAAPRD